jgi:hypothetical protein
MFKSKEELEKDFIEKETKKHLIKAFKEKFIEDYSVYLFGVVVGLAIFVLIKEYMEWNH